MVMATNPFTFVLSTAASTAGAMILDGFPFYVYLDINKKNGTCCLHLYS